MYRRIDESVQLAGMAVARITEWEYGAIEQFSRERILQRWIRSCKKRGRARPSAEVIIRS